EPAGGTNPSPPGSWGDARGSQSRPKEQPHERHHLSDRPDRCDHGDSFVSRPPLKERPMSDVRTYPDPAAAGPVPTPGGPLSYIHWGPVIAGAVLAAAVW